MPLVRGTLRWKEAFLLPIAELTNSLKITLKVISVIGMEALSIWLIWPMVGLVSEDLSFLSLSCKYKVVQS